MADNGNLNQITYRTTAEERNTDVEGREPKSIFEKLS